MADYYRNKFIDDLRGEFAEPIGFSDMSNITPEIVMKNMQAICEENDIPAKFDIVTVEISAGLFRKATYSAVKVWHPNPPQSYCDQLYLITPQGIHFFWVGSSTAFGERNRYEQALNGQGGGIKAQLRAIVGIAPDEEPYEKELEWHGTIYSVFQSLVE